ncbi:MAG: MFS transporter [bacterium]
MKISMIKREVGFYRFYYGWVIVGIALVSMAFWFGIRSIFSIFYVALLEDFPWSRGGAAGVQSLAFLTYTFMAPLIGALIDRLGPRRIIIPGILLLALGLALCSYIKTLNQFYLLYGLLAAIGATCIGPVSYTTILAHWFEKKRGTASGLAISGTGLGTFLLVPLSQQFIFLCGWRLAFVVLGGLVLIVLLPLNGLFLHHKPQELGLRTDGMMGEESPKREVLELNGTIWSETDWTFKKALKTGKFWALVTFNFFAAMGLYIVIVHHVTFLVDQGIDKMAAAFIFALLGIISSPFRIVWGWLSDRIGREKTYTTGTIFLCMGVCSLILLEIMRKRELLYFFVFFFGMGWAVLGPIMMSVAADLFHGRGFGLIFGILEAVIGIGGALGAWVAGFIFDKTQSYQCAFGLAATLSILSCLFIWLAAPRKIHNG